MTTGVEGKSVVVTGGAHGIGAALVDRLLKDGAFVTSLDLGSASRSHPRFVQAIGDVTDPDAHRHSVDLAVRSFGGIDVFIGNAGVHDGGVLLDNFDGGDLARTAERIYAVNVIGLMLGVHACLPHLEKSSGSIIFTLSDASFEAGGVGAGPCYTASKAAGLGLMRNLAATYAPRIRVNAVAPGGVATSLKAVDGQGRSRTLIEDAGSFDSRVKTKNPLGITLRPSEVADYYLYLLSDAAGALTGQILRPDGGLSVS